MQLVAYGAQDVYLTGDPQITFFKVVYRRHTNFALESIEQTFTGSTDLGKSVSCVISRNGDLVSGVHLQVKLPTLINAAEYIDSVGHALIQSAEVEIGGQKIDKHYGEWLDVWDELTKTSEKEAGYNLMVGKGEAAGARHTGGTELYVPLQFWFNRNPGLALPLIALQYHEVKILIKFRPLSELTTAVAGDMANTDFEAQLFVDYIYLDTEERRRFAQMSHEYLIDQLQFTGTESISDQNTTVRLNFNHPVKELIWTFHDQDKTALDYSADALVTGRIQLNGHDRMSSRPGTYFSRVQPYYHHTRCPAKDIYCYSFALRPEEHQPSGSCNFSRIDNASLRIETTASVVGRNINVYAINYNVLRIVSGMGGLAYSN